MKSQNNFTNNDKAVSNMVSVVLLTGIVLVGLGTIGVFGYSEISEQTQNIDTGTTTNDLERIDQYSDSLGTSPSEGSERILLGSDKSMSFTKTNGPEIQVKSVTRTKTGEKEVCPEENTETLPTGTTICTGPTETVNIYDNSTKTLLEKQSLGTFQSTVQNDKLSYSAGAIVHERENGDTRIVNRGPGEYRSAQESRHGDTFEINFNQYKMATDDQAFDGQLTLDKRDNGRKLYERIYLPEDKYVTINTTTENPSMWKSHYINTVGVPADQVTVTDEDATTPGKTVQVNIGEGKEMYLHINLHTFYVTE